MPCSAFSAWQWLYPYCGSSARLWHKGPARPTPDPKNRAKSDRAGGEMEYTCLIRCGGAPSTVSNGQDVEFSIRLTCNLLPRHPRRWLRRVSLLKTLTS